MATTTVSDYFSTNDAEDGAVGFGDESWPIIGGVIFCPVEVAVGTGWKPATTEQVDAYKKATRPSAAKLKAEADVKKADKK